MYKKYNKEILSENITHKICTKRSLRLQRCRSAGYNGQKKFKCTDLWTENVVICRGRFGHKKNYVLTVHMVSKSCSVVIIIWSCIEHQDIQSPKLKRFRLFCFLLVFSVTNFLSHSCIFKMATFFIWIIEMIKEKLLQKRKIPRKSKTFFASHIE